MSAALYSLLLLAALCVAYVVVARQGRTHVEICRACGDLVNKPVLWPVRCPTCGSVIL